MSAHSGFHYHVSEDVTMVDQQEEHSAVDGHTPHQQLNANASKHIAAGQEHQARLISDADQRPTPRPKEFIDRSAARDLTEIAARRCLEIQVLYNYLLTSKKAHHITRKGELEDHRGNSIIDFARWYKPLSAELEKEIQLNEEWLETKSQSFASIKGKFTTWMRDYKWVNKAKQSRANEVEVEEEMPEVNKLQISAEPKSQEKATNAAPQVAFTSLDEQTAAKNGPVGPSLPSPKSAGGSLFSAAAPRPLPAELPSPSILPPSQIQRSVSPNISPVANLHAVSASSIKHKAAPASFNSGPVANRVSNAVSQPVDNTAKGKGKAISKEPMVAAIETTFAGIPGPSGSQQNPFQIPGGYMDLRDKRLYHDSRLPTTEFLGDSGEEENLNHEIKTWYNWYRSDRAQRKIFIP